MQRRRTLLGIFLLCGVVGSCTPSPPSDAQVLAFREDTRANQFLYSTNVRGMVPADKPAFYWIGFKSDEVHAISLRLLRPGSHIGLRVSAPEKRDAKVMECDQANPGSPTECGLEFQTKGRAFLIEIGRKPGVAGGEAGDFQLFALVRAQNRVSFVRK